MAHVKLPPVRKLFKPDSGYMIFDADMSGADAQVVAWEADDKDLMQAFRSGMKIHVKNFEDFHQKPFHEDYKKKVEPGHLYTPYDEMKRAVHATNYYASARTVAATLQWKVVQSQNFQDRWFRLHPGIREWHKRIAFDLQTTRTIRNKLGYRIIYFDRPDNVLPEALAWIPQSTVGLLAARAATDIDELVPWAEVLLQVHDSVIFQLPFHRVTPTSLELIKRIITYEVPYPDPLIIPWGLKASEISWGDCETISWKGERK